MREQSSRTSSTICVERMTVTSRPIEDSRLRKRLRSAGIEAGGRLIDDDEPRVGEQSLGDTEPLLHSAGVRGECLLADVPQVGLLQQRVDHVLALAAEATPLKTAR